MAEVVDNMNVRHVNAQMAGRASTELHTKIFFRGKETLADARVVKVQANGLVVFVPKFGIEGPVFLGKGGEDGAGMQLNEAKQVRGPAAAGGHCHVCMLHVVHLIRWDDNMLFGREAESMPHCFTMKVCALKTLA